MLKWRGYSALSNSWEFAKNLSCDMLKKKFESNQLKKIIGKTIFTIQSTILIETYSN